MNPCLLHLQADSLPIELPAKPLKEPLDTVLIGSVAFGFGITVLIVEKLKFILTDH